MRDKDNNLTDLEGLIEAYSIDDRIFLEGPVVAIPSYDDEKKIIAYR